MTDRAGDVVWRPAAEQLRDSEYAAFVRWLTETGRAAFGEAPAYRDVWQWSVNDVGRFWQAFAEYTGVAGAASQPGAPAAMPGRGWFPGTGVNYAARCLAGDRQGPAIVAIDDDGTRHVTTWEQLRRQVGALAGFLRDSGIAPGDRVAAVLPNRTEAVVGLLAAASVGAVWSVVAPEFGAGAIVSRLAQLDPAVLIAANGYDYAGRRIDRTDVLAEVLGALPALRQLIWVDQPEGDLKTGAAVSDWSDIMAADRPWTAQTVPFEHPLWVLFSSGTTGVPKGIVHGHGGVILEHLKTLTLHSVLRPGDRFLVVGSTSWVVWNTLVSGLLRGCTIVLLDGNPAYPDLGRVWRVAAEEKVAKLGLGAAYVHASMRAGPRPSRDHDLSALRMLHVTGSPLSPDAYPWVYDEIGDVWLASVSGGTDVAGIFLGAAPGEPVRTGRLQPPALGVAAQAWDAAGRPVTGEPGELVITRPMPSMPLYFWSDPDGSRYRESYFSTYPGAWRHGNLVEFDADGSSVIVGRSDSTLNRNGIRMGPADLYRVVEAMPEVREALVVGIEEPDGYYMPLFVQFTRGADPDGAAAAVRQAIRSALSPRYVPDEIFAVSAIPHTRTGKKLEVPVKRLLMGQPLDTVVDPGAVDDIAALAEIRDAVRRPKPANQH